MARFDSVLAAALCLVPAALAFAPMPTPAQFRFSPAGVRRQAGLALRMSLGEAVPVESRRTVLLRVGVAAAVVAGEMGQPGKATAQEAALGGEWKADKKYNGPSAYGFSFKYPKSWKPNKQVLALPHSGSSAGMLGSRHKGPRCVHDVC